jgi:AcrR family transcriptional regulator
MNSKYFNLPYEKQNNLVNAGYKAFALYSYKKASIAMIADEADISKSLLFYYFKNKKEYYLFLFNMAIKSLTKDEKKDGKEKFDLFELVNQIVQHRLLIMHDFPYLIKFATKAYYESDSSVQYELQEEKKHMAKLGIQEFLNIIDYKQFKNASDAEILINIILFIAEGCMRGQENLNNEKINEIVPLFQKMMLSLKNHYYVN